MKSSCVLLFCLVFPVVFGQKVVKFDVNGMTREALIFEPTKRSEKIPAVFVFHGHGGTAKHASRTMDFQNYYSEAIVVFMQGIPGRKVSGIDPKGTMNGWQVFPNDLENRDLYFFDKVVNKLKSNTKIDNEKVFLVGHSNGARFVNVLWKERPEKFTGLISVASQGGVMIMNAEPKSIWMSMGKNDRLVPYSSQQKSVKIVKNNLKINEKPYKVSGDKAFYKGIGKSELVIEDRNAGHEFPKKSISEMVDFFRRQ